MNDEAQSLFKVIGSPKAVDILKYLREQGTAQHRDFHAFTNAHTLNTRLNELITYELIEHHYEKGVKKEWYTLTEKGSQVLAYMEEIAKVL